MLFVNHTKSEGLCENLKWFIVFTPKLARLPCQMHKPLAKWHVLAQHWGFEQDIGIFYEDAFKKRKLHH